MADWNENLQFMLALGTADAVHRADLAERPSLSLALFWGPRWADHPATPESLASLRPEEANQHGRFYPSYRTDAALFALVARPGGEAESVRRIAERGLELLARHGVPLRIE